MAYTVLARSYTQGAIINVMEDISIEKYNAGGATYVGTQINYFDDKMAPQRETIAKVYLDNSHQKQMKSMIQSLKAGQKVTFYKERAVPESSVAGKTEEEKKALGFWGLASIYDGHVIPSEITNNASAPAAGGAPAENYDAKGVAIGHAIKCANRLLTPAKAKDTSTFVAAANAFHDLTIALQDEFSDAKKASVGLAVLEGAERAKEFKEVEAIARSIIVDVNPLVTEHVEESIAARKEAKAAEKEAEVEEKEEVEEVEEVKSDFDDNFDDDIPF